MRLLSLLAFLGFGCSLAVHISTFWGIDWSQKIPGIWLLHIGIFVVFVPMVLSLKGVRNKEDFWPRFFASMPQWIASAVICLFFYTFINFALFFFSSAGGRAAEQDGKYILQDRGRVVQEISEQEYHQRNAYVLRGFSGHWMLFYFIPAVYFWYPQLDKKGNP